MTNEAEAEALSLNLNDLWNGISATESEDAASGEAQFADVTIGLTTVVIEGCHPGAAGSLIQPAINAQQGASARLQIQRDILCSATCWDANDPSNPMSHDEDYDCDTSDPTIPEGISFEYLDCMCGEDSWGTGANCGSGNEEGLIRDDTEFTFLIVTDEGDGSRRLANQASDPSPYLDLMDGFNMPYQVAVVGPYWDDETMLCNSGGATTWGTERYQQAALTTGGLYNFISEEDAGGDCQISAFSEHLADLASLLTN